MTEAEEQIQGMLQHIRADHAVLQQLFQIHNKVGPFQRQPYHRCIECNTQWPCKTYRVLTRGG